MTFCGTTICSIIAKTAARGPRRILVIEDHEDGRKSLCRLLTLYGGVVEGAADGPEGVRKGLELRPDIAVVDINLPDLDGYQIARQLRSALGSDIFLIAHTAYRRDERDASFDAWLTKPADPGEWLRYLV